MTVKNMEQCLFNTYVVRGPGELYIHSFEMELCAMDQKYFQVELLMVVEITYLKRIDNFQWGNQKGVLSNCAIMKTTENTEGYWISYREDAKRAIINSVAEVN